MSHTIGQDKHDNQHSSNSSQANRDSQKPESNTPTPNSLSDADYEFLFDQLLKGIAHGWHERRIINFFARLSDRANQDDWIAWLERIKPWLLELPIQSKHQLGKILIRLGELTKSTTEANRIGAICSSLGREMLLGDTSTAIWEYVGEDLESKRNERSSADLGVDSTTNEHQEENPTTADNNEDTIDRLRDTAPTSARKSSLTVSVPIETITETSSDSNGSLERDLDEIGDRYSKDFEFESSQRQPALENTSILPDHWVNNARVRSSQTENSPTTDLPFAASEELASTARGIDRSNEAPTRETSEPWDDDPPTIDMQQVMQLIQADPELARQISDKLNISLTSQGQRSPVDEKPHKSNRELIESWFNLGLKQASAGAFERAIASWEKALSIDPNLSEAWHNRGSALGRLGNYEAAIESFENALAIDPHNYQAWNDRAHALYQLENWVEAVNSWNNALKIVPGNHLFWYNRGCALEQLQQWSEAIASYEKSLEIKPDFQPGRSRYINLVADNSRSN